MIATRFNPSLNGPLHLGHLSTLLMNERFAHNMGGKFYVRFDDTSVSSNRPGKRMYKIRDLQQKDIEWLGIKVDGWFNQMDQIEHARQVLKETKFPLLPENEEAGYVLPISIRLGNTFLFYPFCPRQTAERVVMDKMLDITHVIRGEDFLTEVSFYSFGCKFLDYSIPEFICLSRMTSSKGDISKTNGGFTLAEYRANGYSSEEIISQIEKACLINPPNGWNPYNLKRDPIWTL